MWLSVSCGNLELITLGWTKRSYKKGTFMQQRNSNFAKLLLYAVIALNRLKFQKEYLCQENFQPICILLIHQAFPILYSLEFL